MSKRYVLATISLDRMPGGLERNITSLANRLTERGCDAGLVTFDQEDARSFYRIDDRVRWYKTGVSQPHAAISFAGRLRLILAIRRILKDTGASVLICFHHGILVRLMAASLFLKIAIVVSERNSLTLYDHIRQSKWNLNFLLLFLVNQIVVQFPRYAEDYPRLLRRRIVVIPNPVLSPVVPARRDTDDERKPLEMLAVGRLCAQKNFGILISVFAGLASRHPDWNLVIVGDGEMRVQLVEDIVGRGLDARIRLVPAISSPSEMSDMYRRASLFCMPSKWEGFPNALAEAMAHGLPAVGYRDCAGVGDLVVHGETGLLAAGSGDTQSLSRALSGLMTDRGRREEMGRAAERAIRRFHPDLVFPKWEALLHRAGNHE